MTASIVGGLTLLLGATTVFGELQSALDRIWRAPAAPSQGLWGLIRSRLLSFGMILAIGFLLLVSLVVSAALGAIGKWWGHVFGSWELVLHLLNLVVSLATVTVLFALIYKLLPRVKVAWYDVWVGAAVTAILFTVGKFAIGLYLGRSDITSGFGAAGSVVLLLVWVYYSAQIFLLGAEFTWVFAHRVGSRSAHSQAVEEGPAPRREPVSEAPRQPATMPAGAGAQPAAAPAARLAGARHGLGWSATGIALGLLMGVFNRSRARRRP